MGKGSSSDRRKCCCQIALSSARSAYRSRLLSKNGTGLLLLADTLKHFGCELGAQTNFNKETGTSIVNGAHDAKKLSEVLELFIKRYVQCYNCGNPETVVKVRKEKITLKCKACGHISEVDMREKLTTFIVKNPPDNKVSKAEDKVKRAEKEKMRPAEREARRLEKAEAKKKEKKERTYASPFHHPGESSKQICWVTFHQVFLLNHW
jgi:translation initiation factor 2 beta subunit (eIF-2beta)/eIF-5